MGLCMVIALVEFIGFMGNGVALVLLKDVFIHACYYYHFMIELLGYVFNYILSMLTLLDLMLLFLWCTYPMT